MRIKYSAQTEQGEAALRNMSKERGKKGGQFSVLSESPYTIALEAREFRDVKVEDVPGFVRGVILSRVKKFTIMERGVAPIDISYELID